MAGIASTSPALTEIVKALGKEEKLVVVSDYCKNLSTLPRLGTALNLNMESLLRSGATKVYLEGGGDLKINRKLGKLGLRVHSYRLVTYKDILATIKAIARDLDVSWKGDRIVEKIEKSFPSKPVSKKVLMVVATRISLGKVLSAHVAGVGSFYHHILHRLGMVNVAEKQSLKRASLMVDREFISRMDPDYIVLLFPEVFSSKRRQAIVAAWKREGKRGALKVIQKDYAILPGPRIDRLVGDLL